MKTYVQSGETVGMTAPYAVSAGGGAKIGSLFGIAQADAASGATVQLATRGVFTVAKTSALAITAGAKLYWDDTNKVLTTTASTNLLVGIALEAAANPSATVVALLTGAFTI